MDEQSTEDEWDKYGYPKKWKDKFPWIKPVNEVEASCNICDCYPMTAQCSVFVKHAASKTHTGLANSNKENNPCPNNNNQAQPTIKNVPLPRVERNNNDPMEIVDSNVSKPALKQKKVKKKLVGEALIKKNVAELKFCAMVALDDLSFKGAARIDSRMKIIYSDSETANSTQLDRKRIAAIIEKVIAPEHKKRLIPILQEAEFSVMLDETKTCADESYIAILVKILDVLTGKITETVWEILAAHSGNEKNVKASGEYIAKILIKSFLDANIDLHNIIAFLSDTCSVMMGCNKGVAAYLMKLIPGIKIIGCLCHVEHLLGQDCWECVPVELRELLSAIPRYIRGSAKKSYKWILCQERFEKIPNLRVLNAIFIRWLTKYGVLLRTLRRYTVLIYYFEFEVVETSANVKPKLQANPSDKHENNVETPANVKAQLQVDSSVIDKNSDAPEKNEKNAAWILQQLKDVRIRGYMLFLEAMLSRLCLLNVRLQAVKPIVRQYNDLMTDLYIDYLKMYMLDKYIENTPVTDINPTDRQYFKPLDELYIGQNAKKFLNDSKHLIVADDFLAMCQTYLIYCCTRMRERCDFSINTNFYFHRNNAFDPPFHAKYPDLDDFFLANPQFRVSKSAELRAAANKQWARLIQYQFPVEVKKKLDSLKNVDEFWFAIKNYVDSTEDCNIFEIVAGCALTSFKFPHSNASTERTWSKNKRIVRNDRSKLAPCSIRGLHLASQYITDLGGFEKFEPNDEMLTAMNFPLRARARKTERKSAKEDAGAYGNIDITKEDQRSALEDEVFFRTPYSDTKTINFTEKLNMLNNEFSEDGESPLKKKRKKVSSIEQDNMVFDGSMNVTSDVLTKFASIQEEIENREIARLLELIDRLDEEERLFSEEIEWGAIKIFDDTAEINIGSNIPIEMHLNPDLPPNYAFVNIINNHLVDDFSYYMLANGARTVGRYKGSENHPFRDRRSEDDEKQQPTMYTPTHQFILFARDFQTLRLYIYVNSEVMDSFGTASEKYWINTVFLSVQLTRYVLVTYESHPPSRNFFLYHMNRNFKGKFLMPYLYNDHYCLFVADCENNVTYHLDPMRASNKFRASMCHNNFMKFLKSTNHVQKNNMHDIEWTNVVSIDERPLQDDGNSCGLWVMYMMDCIGRGKRFDENFDPVEYRTYVAQFLINESEDMENTCMYCFSTRIRNDNNEEELQVKCGICLRFAHLTCKQRCENGSDFSGMVCKACLDYIGVDIIDDIVNDDNNGDKQ